ncbi:type II toxin-antitoxin system VapB family antitoxin [Candidatus Mycobacterium methanotrophicum]|uniref:Type II toxin-antitoxin system VapB family antitoxin n=1 Tax=Candidatus Mycobacterium methanotrophicum TaxID=2943498 RepID=A0ABY4QIQ2_9MYCO|nr:type II toxin-antitoxin system VapB family antitoxin [Candidatus Mycobacterium methanotrophicum]UQX10223.1 type II toxin-antitoxin system VapB family antitoxin [Candidatus Mycobacterium methanotrophicum]
MALNIKDPELVRLAEELAARMGHNNKTRAIRDALSAQLSLLEAQHGDRATHLLDVMRTEIWPLLPPQPPITKDEREQILGYDPEIGA